jgi:hypothetical protein
MRQIKVIQTMNDRFVRRGTVAGDRRLDALTGVAETAHLRSCATFTASPAARRPCGASFGSLATWLETFLPRRLWTGERKGETGWHELFSFLTTEANEAVRPVHAKAMPVLLTAAGDWDTWLAGPVDEAMALQRPLSDAMLRVVAAGDKTDGTKPT